MKIRFTRSVSYPQNDASQSREYAEGSVHDVPVDQARRWFRRNAAVEFEEKPKRKLEPESTVAPAKPSKSENV